MLLEAAFESRNIFVLYQSPVANYHRAWGKIQGPKSPHHVYINVIEIEEGGGNIAEWRCHRFKGDVDLFKASSKQRESVGNSGRNCNRERRVHAGKSKELYRETRRRARRRETPGDMGKGNTIFCSVSTIS